MKIFVATLHIVGEESCNDHTGIGRTLFDAVQEAKLELVLANDCDPGDSYPWEDIEDDIRNDVLVMTTSEHELKD